MFDIYIDFNWSTCKMGVASFVNGGYASLIGICSSIKHTIFKHRFKHYSFNTLHIDDGEKKEVKHI